MADMRDLDASKAALIRRISLEVKDERVINAIARVPRELFVPPASRHLAYDDIPLPIDMGQTISQPLIVAMMTEALELGGRERVLEVGTGSGYQAAILAELASRVVSVERHRRLMELARQTLADLGYKNIEIHRAGETIGWEEAAPYNGIIVTAGAPQVPPELVDQLAEGGNLIIPVGSRNEQLLLKVSKRRGRILTTELGGCRFVPLIAKGAWPE